MALFSSSPLYAPRLAVRQQAIHNTSSMAVRGFVKKKKKEEKKIKIHSVSVLVECRVMLPTVWLNDCEEPLA